MTTRDMQDAERGPSGAHDGLAFLFLTADGDVESLAAAARRLPGVTSVAVTSAEWDLIVEVRPANVDELADVVGFLRRTPGLARIALAREPDEGSARGPATPVRPAGARVGPVPVAAPAAPAAVPAAVPPQRARPRLELLDGGRPAHRQGLASLVARQRDRPTGRAARDPGQRTTHLTW